MTKTGIAAAIAIVLSIIALLVGLMPHPEYVTSTVLEGYVKTKDLDGNYAKAKDLDEVATYMKSNTKQALEQASKAAADVEKLQGELAQLKKEVSAASAACKSCQCNRPSSTKTKTTVAKPPQAPPPHLPTPAQDGASTPPPPPAQPRADLWKWRFPDSSATNPKPCVVERLTGEPKPAFCSELRVETPVAGETREEWRTRVTAKMGLVNPHTYP